MALNAYVEKKENVARISTDTPLIRELNILENVALILEYHKNFSIKKAEHYVYQLFEKCGVKNIKYKKVYEINKRNIIIIKYIRAYVSDFDTILIISPFSMLDKVDDIEITFELFKLLDDKIVEIVDLKSNNYYKDKNVI